MTETDFITMFKLNGMDTVQVTLLKRILASSP